MDREPDYWRRCDDGAQPPPAIAEALLRAWLAGEALEFAGERYAPVWRMSL